MKWTEANLPAFSNDDGIEIYLDENYQKGWWQSCPDFKYLYVHDKTAKDTGVKNCITMFKDGYEEGYFICEKNFLICDEHEFSAYDTYLNVLEFGLDDCAESSVNHLIDYLFEFARYMGVKFVKISTKEDFSNFYQLISSYASAKENDCIILKVNSPIEYEDLKHLKSYADDGITFEQLCFLWSRRFTLERRQCHLKIGDDLLAVDRKTGKITFPNFVKNDCALPLILDDENCGLIAFLTADFNLAKERGLTVGLQIADLPYSFALLGNEKLLVFNDITLSKDVFDILYKMESFFGVKKYSFYNVSLVKNSLWQGYSFSHRDLSAETQNARICLDLDGYTLYPPKSAISSYKEFNEKLNGLTEFGIAIESNDRPFKTLSATINKDKFEFLLVNDDKTEKRLSIAKEKFLKTLKNACFFNWKKVYKKPVSASNFVWAIVLKFGQDCLTYQGANDVPKIWKYLLNELLLLINE